MRIPEDCYCNVIPEIKELRFVRKKMVVKLVDGRIFILPISAFPSILKIPENERNNFTLLSSSEFTWEGFDKVYNLDQVIGKYEIYYHESDYTYDPSLLIKIKNKGEGFAYVVPRFTRFFFRNEETIEIHFRDKRVLICPLERFPGIRVLPLKKRRKYEQWGWEIQWDTDFTNTSCIPEDFLGFFWK